jgi:hypothetical protein
MSSRGRRYGFTGRYYPLAGGDGNHDGVCSSATGAYVRKIGLALRARTCSSDRALGGQLVRQNRAVDIDKEHARWTAIERDAGYIRARLRLLTADEGGRRTPIGSGYRSHWAFPPDVHDERHDAPLTLESGPDNWLDPSEETTVRLHPLLPDLWPPVAPGLRLTMLEGARVVGVAKVVQVVAPAA